MNVNLAVVGLHILAHLSEMLLQYPHQFWKRLTRMFYYACSISRKSNCWDNTQMERYTR